MIKLDTLKRKAYQSTIILTKLLSQMDEFIVAF